MEGREDRRGGRGGDGGQHGQEINGDKEGGKRRGREMGVERRLWKGGRTEEGAGEGTVGSMDRR